jgi:hypothetical protein
MDKVYRAKGTRLAELPADICGIIRSFTWEQRWALLYETRTTAGKESLIEEYSAPIFTWNFRNCERPRRSFSKFHVGLVGGDGGCFQTGIRIFKGGAELEVTRFGAQPRLRLKTNRIDYYSQWLFGEAGQHILYGQNLYTSSLSSDGYVKACEFGNLGEDCIGIDLLHDELLFSAESHLFKSSAREPERRTTIRLDFYHHRAFILDPHITLSVNPLADFTMHDTRDSSKTARTCRAAYGKVHELKRCGSAILLYETPKTIGFARDLRVLSTFDPRTGWVPQIGIQYTPYGSAASAAIYWGA